MLTAGGMRTIPTTPEEEVQEAAKQAVRSVAAQEIYDPEDQHSGWSPSVTGDVWESIKPHASKMASRLGGNSNSPSFRCTPTVSRPDNDPLKPITTIFGTLEISLAAPR